MHSKAAKKHLGQHFLNDPGIIQKIINVADPTPDEITLEIGPGTGALTEPLLKLGQKIVALETDNDMISILEEKYGEFMENGMLDLVKADVLKWDEVILSRFDEPYAIIANIPYYITGAILRKFLESPYQPSSMTLIMQREVAERIVERNEKGSILSHSIAIYGDASTGGIIKRGSFTPPPKVDSAILRIENISKSFFTENLKAKSPNTTDLSCEALERQFFVFLHDAFGHKRKQLLTNFKKCNNYTQKQLDLTRSFLVSHEISEKVRAEDLTHKNIRSLFLEII